MAGIFFKYIDIKLRENNDKYYWSTTRAVQCTSWYYLCVCVWRYDAKTRMVIIVQKSNFTMIFISYFLPSFVRLLLFFIYFFPYNPIWIKMYLNIRESLEYCKN